MPSRAAHSLGSINHPTNAVLTKDICKLKSLVRQDPRTDPYVPKPIALVTLPVCAGAQGSDTAVFPAAVGPRRRKLSLVLQFFSAELPSPCNAFCTSKRTWLLKEKYRLCSASTLTKIDLYFN